MARTGMGSTSLSRVATACVAVVAVAACGTPGPERPATPAKPLAPSASSPASSPAPVDTEPSGPSRLIRIALAGDVHFEGPLAARLRDPSTALAPATEALAAADVAIVNLETSVGTGGRPEPGKRFTFSAGPAALEALSAVGVDVATMANNHALDYGRARLPSTLRAVRAAADGVPPLAVIGVGRDVDEAFEPALVDVRGTLVAILTASVADQDPTADTTSRWAAGDERGGIADALDPARLLEAVRRTRRGADVVVVYLHWGIQGQRCPSTDQRSLARSLVDAGADIVAGSHAHELQGDGRLGSGYVAYGLGNFAWYSPGPTGVLTLTVRPPIERSGQAEVVRSAWWPAQIGSDGLARRVRGAAAAAFRDERASLRTCAGLAD